MAGTIKHEWNGTVLTITSDSGTSSADLKGEKGDDGARGAQGAACSVATDTTHLGGITAAEYALKTELPQITAYNLLDNSYFPAAYLINQRGQTTYTGKGYNIDRWRTNYSGDITAIGENGITNTTNSTASGWHLHQILNNVEQFRGNTLTAACYVNDVSGGYFHLLISFRNANDTEIEHSNKKIVKGINIISGIVPENTVYIRVGIYAYSGVAANNYYSLKWIALYNGEYTEETLPQYYYKGYAAELLECQRYFFKSPIGGNIQGSGIVSSTLNEVLINVVVPVNMRITPSINIISNGSIRSGGTHQTVETLTVRGMSSNIVSLRAVVINNFPANYTAALVNASFELSAEL